MPGFIFGYLKKGLVLWIGWIKITEEIIFKPDKTINYGSVNLVSKWQWCLHRE